MATQTLQPKPALKKRAVPAGKKTSVADRKIVAKKPAQVTGEVMLWDDIVKKYPGYHVLLKDPEYKPKNAVYPIKGELICKNKNYGKMVEQFLQIKPSIGKVKLYDLEYIEDPNDTKKTRPIFIL
jgi:hypothetical protein